jgi:hypothetical protein
MLHEGFLSQVLQLAYNGYVQCLVALVAVIGSINFRKRQKRTRLQEKWDDAGKDVVVLHMPDRKAYLGAGARFTNCYALFLY